MFIVDLSECCCAGLAILDDFDIRARHGGFDPRFDLLQAFHSLGAFDHRWTKNVGFAGGSRSCLPNSGTGNSLGCSGSR